MEEMKHVVLDLYEGLKGTREKNGSLMIKEYGYEDYENLYFLLLDELKPFFQPDYTGWYARTVRSYVRYKKAKSKTFDAYIPQRDNPMDMHTIQEQLAVIKYFLYRRATGKYTK